MSVPTSPASLPANADGQYTDENGRVFTIDAEGKRVYVQQ